VRGHSVTEKQPRAHKVGADESDLIRMTTATFDEIEPAIIELMSRVWMSLTLGIV
jgi:hypothetical protein